MVVGGGRVQLLFVRFSPGPAAKGRLANGAGIAVTIPFLPTAENLHGHYRPPPTSSTPAPRRQGGPSLYCSRFNISRLSPAEPPFPPPPPPPPPV